jgi:hypothetical protein
MSPHPRLYALLRHVSLVSAIACAGALGVHAQEAQPPAYLAVVTGEATLERSGETEPAAANMPFVVGDRLRTGAGRVEIVFPDGTAIEVAEHSEVEAVSTTRVRLIAGTMDHIQRPIAASQSSTYLPQDLQTYGSTFDQYGSWQYDQPYGYVWYPQVGPDWRPYSYGAWSPIRPYGWTWVGAEAWAWPTHHYGRWGFARNAWFWIPGRTWGAAWVSWSFADDYVSWCPLGWNGRPIFALSIGSRRGWDYWTVPRRTFETRAYGRNYATYYRGGRDRDSIVGRREAFGGNRTGRPAFNERSTNANRRSATDFRRPSQAVNLPAANGGAIAVPRVGTRDSFGNRPPTDARPTPDYRRSPTGSRLPTADARRPTTDSRLSTADSRQGAPEGVYAPSPSYRGREQAPRQTYAPPQVTVPAANGGRGVGYSIRPSASAAAVARPRAYPDARTDNRSSGAGYRPPTLESRQPAGGGYRPPAAEARPRREASAGSGGAAAPRSMPHERAAPAAGGAQGQGRRR